MPDTTDDDQAGPKHRWFMAEFLPEGLPEKLYKFSAINANFYSGLKEGYLWHSRPLTFNDPFDCYKHLLKFEPSEADIVDFCTRNYKTGDPPLNQQIINLLRNPQHLVDAQWESLEDSINGQGICCFAENYSNTLMWSHYANNHSGICLVFSPHLDLTPFIVKVRYTSNFTPLNYYENNRIGALVMLSTKSEDWAYESEYRSISATPGKNHFDKKMLTEIIFGCKTSRDDIFDVIDAIEKSGYKNVAFTKTYMETDSFRLGFRPLMPFQS
ncbi:hypothetical protein A0256_15465 [Mucilaginibacter sp. PAMC 26640]|nr:hypothetical protein A0256_15465 [Mucilaginibacter sp. PAMC 26640]